MEERLDSLIICMGSYSVLSERCDIEAIGKGD